MSDEAKLDLAAIKARCAAATTGPWLIENGDLCDNAGEWLGAFDAFYSLEDTEFVAAARTDVPALVAEVERLRERVTELEIGVREIAIMHQDDRPGIGEPSGDFDWRLRSEAQERVARALLAKGSKS